MPKVRLVNPSRRRRSRAGRKRRQPAALRKYWAAARRAMRSNAGGGHMAKRKRSSHRRRSHHRRSSAIVRRRISNLNRRAGQGAWIGMVVAVGQRFISERFGAGTAAATAGMSGDLDFDLGYYLADPFPFAQGASAGPYASFPGAPYSPGLPTANAAAPGRWRQTAQLVAAGAPSVTGGGSASVAQPGAQTAAYQPGAWG